MKKIQHSVCAAGSASNRGSKFRFASVMIVESVVASLYLDMTEVIQ